MGKEMYILLLLPVACFCFSEFPYSNIPQDPCGQFTELGDVSSRSPDNSGGPVVNDDINLAQGWYAAPAGWELLNRDPGRWNTCGTEKPIYRTDTYATTSDMCIRSESDPCSVKTTIETRMCGVREIYNLHTSVGSSAFCFECTGRMLDILIISDVSRSIGSTTFEKMKQFQESLLTSIDISLQTDVIALIEFSKNPRVLIPLDSPISVKKADVLSMINQQQYENGPSTELADALDMAVTEVFIAQKGDRSDAENMVILFTDGLVTVSEMTDLTSVIGQLSAKAELLVVASSGVNSAIRAIASEPKDAHIFNLDGQNEVTKIKDKIMACSPKMTGVRMVE